MSREISQGKIGSYSLIKIPMRTSECLILFQSNLLSTHTQLGLHCEPGQEVVQLLVVEEIEAKGRRVQDLHCPPTWAFVPGTLYGLASPAASDLSRCDMRNVDVNSLDVCGCKEYFEHRTLFYAALLHA